MRDRIDLIEMYSIWVKPDFLSREALASRCADEAIRFAKEYHKEQLILNGVVGSKRKDTILFDVGTDISKESISDLTDLRMYNKLSEGNELYKVTLISRE
jgi:hypothetical protein